VGPRTGMDDVENRKPLTLARLELRPLDRPARSQSLYQLRYPVSSKEGKAAQFLNKQMGRGVSIS
jgi:hypothetical protein